MVFQNEDNGANWNQKSLSNEKFGTYDIIIGDINGDGTLDILEANSDERNFFYMNTTKGGN